MPDSYEWALFLHLVGVFALAGGTISFILLTSMMRRAEEVQEVRPWAQAAFVVDKLVPASAIVIFVTGVWMLEFTDRGFSWGDGWINTSLGTLILMGVAWVFVNTRKIGAIRSAAREAPDGPLPQVLAAQVVDPVLFATTHAVTLTSIAILWNMTTKPGDAQAGIIVLLGIVIGVVSAVPAVIRQQRVLERGGESE
jgi:uncharacterized membrane protein